MNNSRGQPIGLVFLRKRQRSATQNEAWLRTRLTESQSGTSW